MTGQLPSPAETCAACAKVEADRLARRKELLARHGGRLPSRWEGQSPEARS